MYGSTYANMYSPQANIDRINTQIAELEKMRSQLQQPIQTPTNLTQNFQLAPSNRETMKYANSLEEVKREVVVSDTPYFSKDMGIVWIKNTKGEVRTYELNEIIPKDEKDLQIELLQSQIRELKREMKNNDANVTNDDANEITTNTEWDDEPIGNPIEKDKPTSVQRVQTSKKR